MASAPSNSYDDLGNLLQEASPDRGPTFYTHDGAGNVITITNALGQVTTYTYDALNRVSVQQSSQASTSRYNYYYDNACGKGRLCAVQQNGQFHLYFGYDALGRENYRLNATGAAWVYYATTHSPGGRLTSLIYPTGRSVDYQYDPLGRISLVSTTAGNTTTVLAQNFIHQPFGPVQSFSFGNTRNYWTSFDQAYRPVFLFSGPLYKLHDYDPAGNLKSRTDINNTAQTFGYSPLNELTSAGDTQTGSYGNLAYSYLPNGNRESETRNGVSTPYYYYANTNRLYHAGNSDWRLMDQAGNTIWSNALWGVSYDGYGRLLSSSKAQSSYGYNALNQRSKKTAGGVTTSFLYGPKGELLYETDGTNNKAYVYLNDMPLARADNNSQIYYYHTDHLGTPQQMTDSAGTTVWKASYEPFGQAVVTNQTIQNNVRLAGQYWDGETGLHYNWHRYYDPRIGRYISSDPIGLAGGLNTYTYGYNNPLRYTDPAGLSGIDTLYMPDNAPLVVAGRAIGGLAALIGGVTTGNQALTDAALEGLADNQQTNIDTLALLATLGRGRTSGEMCRVDGNAGKIVAKGGTEITGFTGHGINRAIGDGSTRAGVKPQAILDALKNPKKITEGIDSQGRPFQVFQGENARVIVNPQTGKIVSTNPLSAAGAH